MGSIAPATQPLKVIVVGAGFGGLAAAIECVQRGFDVTLVERYRDSNSYGGQSMLSLTPTREVVA